MIIPTDLTRSQLISWLTRTMAEEQMDMGRYAPKAFPGHGEYVEPIFRASNRRLFAMCRGRYEQARAALVDLGVPRKHWGV